MPPETQPPAAAAAARFEVALEQLQQLVKRMESGELNLEQALGCFEEGVRLTRFCQEQLAGAERRIELLVKPTGAAGEKVELQPFPGGNSRG